ncbi:MAG TPA: leucyl aminopeptidase, partial [Pirellulales bacterium]
FGCYGQDLYRTEKKRHPFGQLLWAGGSHEAVEQGKIVGECLIMARRLVNEPPNVVYPESFAETAVQVATEYGIDVEVWNEKKLADERCGSLLAVCQGSVRPARMVIWRWNGGPADQAPLAIVGKGVTFDSGGLSLKPSDSMRTMKYDMSGAANTLAAMTAIARLRLPVNVIGLAGLVENMPSGSAVKLGDVLTARSGKTIEVLNTDAEGRLVLADVLNVAVTMGASRIIDLATLTGACVVALGNDVGGLMANNDEWAKAVLAAAERTGELVWQLPMFPEYNDDVKSDIADIRNVGAGRWAGAIAGAKFLEHFVADVPWVHLDIAGPAYLESAKSWCDGGATGYFIRTLIELAREAARATAR